MGEEKDFIWAIGDDDKEERKYYEGDKILKSKTEYRINCKYTYDFLSNPSTDSYEEVIENKFYKNISFNERQKTKPEINKSYVDELKELNKKEVDMAELDIQSQIENYSYPPYIPHGPPDIIVLIINSYLLLIDINLKFEFNETETIDAFKSLNLKSNTVLDCVIIRGLTLENVNNFEVDESVVFKNVLFLEVDEEIKDCIKKRLSEKQLKNSYFDDSKKLSEFMNNRSKEKDFYINQILIELEMSKKENKNYKNQEEMRAKAGIEKICSDFAKEESNWGIGLICFLAMIFLIFLCFNISIEMVDKISIGLFLFSALYFIIHQYSKAKNLRIENQNKLALIHELKAFELSENISEKAKIILPNYADVIFTKAIPDKNEKNLPIDELIKLKSIFKE